MRTDSESMGVILIILLVFVGVTWITEWMEQDLQKKKEEDKEKDLRRAASNLIKSTLTDDDRERRVKFDEDCSSGIEELPSPRPSRGLDKNL